MPAVLGELESDDEEFGEARFWRIPCSALGLQTGILDRNFFD